jgi:uroporphyrinogen-III decarboxylase
LRISLGFEPAWYHQRCGVDFSKRWHTDPFYRHETLVTMKAELHRAFPMVAYWDLARSDDTWTLSGCYGAYVIPQVFGCKLRYAPDRWPVIVERPKRSLEEWAALDVDELLAHPFVRELLGQMDVIEAAAGKIHGYLTWHSTINNAFNLREQALFTDMVDQPELTHRFLALVTEVMMRLAAQVQARQRRSGFTINQLDISNCVMNMISPRAYRNFIFPYDAHVAESFERFGVHTCNWDATPYLNELKRLPKVGYLDMGIMSDLRRARELFPEARRAVMYSPVRLNDAPLGEIRADMLKIYTEMAPCDVVMADIQAQTPDERVIALLDMCREIEEQGMEA